MGSGTLQRAAKRGPSLAGLIIAGVRPARREIPFKGAERGAAPVLGRGGQPPCGPHPNPAPRGPSLGTSQPEARP